MMRPNGDPYDDRDPSSILVSFDDVILVEQNRGKAGALNVYKDFLTVKAAAWVAQNDIPGRVQVFMGIIDARHMLAEPEIFWNDAFPFFARNKDSGESAKDYGELSTTQQCIMVQYPQFFTNVTRDDFLDNKNSAYYTIWQTLRDCGKCITSSGTNAIWSASLPSSLPCRDLMSCSCLLSCSLSLCLQGDHRPYLLLRYHLSYRRHRHLSEVHP
jgi:hypothetical protein